MTGLRIEVELFYTDRQSGVYSIDGSATGAGFGDDLANGGSAKAIVRSNEVVRMPLHEAVSKMLSRGWHRKRRTGSPCLQALRVAA